MSKINEELIEKYKNDKVLIQTYYTDNNGINIDEIVNPIKIDNRQLISPIDNQQNYPACAGYSACTVIESLLWKRTGKLVQLDSKQVYAKIAKKSLFTMLPCVFLSIIVIPVTAALLELQKVCQCCCISRNSEAP